VDVNVGVPGAVVSLQLSTGERVAVSCVLYIRDDKFMFSRLHDRRDEIEAAIGSELEWLDLPERKASQVVLRRNGDWRDESLAQDLAQWLVTTADKFGQVFSEYQPVRLS
jgi:hypothetical protein